jgi:hypothetical protein
VGRSGVCIHGMVGVADCRGVRLIQGLRRLKGDDLVLVPSDIRTSVAPQSHRKNCFGRCSCRCSTEFARNGI